MSDPVVPRAIVRERHIRRRGLLLMLGGAVVGAAWIAFVTWLSTKGISLWGPGLGVPGVLFLIGVVELISGRSLAELSQRWDDLKGWQRGVLGTAIVLISIPIIIAIMGTIAVVLAD